MKKFDNFKLLTNTEKTIQYITDVLVSFPRKEKVLKENMESSIYDMMECIFSYKINKSFKIKLKNLNDLLIKLSMLDFYTRVSFRKKLINDRKLEVISNYILEIKKICYGVIEYENKNSVQ